MSAHLRLLEDWHQDEEAADDEEDDGQDDVHLDRSLEVGLFPPVTHFLKASAVAALPEVEETTDGKSDEEGFDKGGEVDENVDIRRREHGQRNQALRGRVVRSSMTNNFLIADQ